MLTLTSLPIWLPWQEAGSGGSGITDRGETGFAGSSGSGFAGMGETGFTGSSGSGIAGSMQVALDLALLVDVKLVSLIAVDLNSFKPHM